MAKLVTPSKYLTILLLFLGSASIYDGSGTIKHSVQASKLQMDQFVKNNRLPQTPKSQNLMQLGQTINNQEFVSQKQQKALKAKEELVNLSHHVEGIDQSLVSFEKVLDKLLQSKQKINQSVSPYTQRDTVLNQLSTKLRKDAETLEQDLAQVEQKNEMTDEQDTQSKETESASSADRGLDESSGNLYENNLNQQKNMKSPTVIKQEFVQQQNNDEELNENTVDEDEQIQSSQNQLKQPGDSSSFVKLNQQQKEKDPKSGTLASFWNNHIQLKIDQAVKNLNGLVQQTATDNDDKNQLLNPILVQLETSANKTIDQLQKREIERTQLMIALYLGVGITIFLILVGVCVECIRKRYYDEQDAETSLDSYDEVTNESHKQQSKKKKSSRSRDRDGEEIVSERSQDPMDKREKMDRSKKSQGLGSRNIRKEGGTRDHIEYEESADHDKKRDCYEHITRNTANCCTYCLSREDNDLEELEYKAYKRQRERKTRAGTGDDSGGMFDFEYFGDRGSTTQYIQEQEQLNYQQQQQQRRKGTLNPNTLQSADQRRDYFIVQEQSRDEIEISYDKARRITQKKRNEPVSKKGKSKRDKSAQSSNKYKSLRLQSQEYDSMSPYSMTKYKHNMRKPSYMLQDRSDTERLDASKQSSSSFMASGQKVDSPFVNYSDNEDALRRQERALNIQKPKQEVKSDKNSDSPREGGYSESTTLNHSNANGPDSVLLKSNNINISFQNLIN